MVPPVPLEPFLPNLPEAIVETSKSHLDSVHYPRTDFVPSAFDLVSRFLVYPSEKRLTAPQATEHPWFMKGVLMPVDYPDEIQKECSKELEGKSLGYWLKVMLGLEGDA